MRDFEMPEFEPDFEVKDNLVWTAGMTELSCAKRRKLGKMSRLRPTAAESIKNAV